MKTASTPRAASARAVSSAVSPAPTTRTRALLEVAERPLRQLDRDLRHRERALGERGLGARALAGGQGAAEEPVEHRPGRVLDQRQLVGALDLALDLGLADDHRLEAGGDPEEMPGGAGAAQRVEVRDELGRADVRLAGEHASACDSAFTGRTRTCRARCGCRSRSRPPRRSRPT